ncbi:MFS transporter [Uliginosibacterium sp. 31-16]|uniref:MFS transporter n=1 Tax=Uliginosibacterium sp. 31-16 TaxID=3068315 RepID=UPI00273FBEDF|nr:MFS transporter [Uliginosibacterium sp. 31-16]MDP5240054.1 MFS transporter [Uliginosibacterium sp. 31-16]
MQASNPLFQNRSFLAFWATRMCTTMANQMMMVAVGWQMYDLTHSAWDLGLVGLYQFLPALALTLVVGQVADRFDRRRVLGLCLVAQALIVAGLIWATFSGWISREHILLAAVALGVTKAFQMPTQQALGPLLVPAELLPRALAFNSAGVQFAIIAGPAAGGFVYVAGAHAVYGLCGLLFVAAAGFLAPVRYDHQPTLAREPVTRASLFAGIRFIWQRKAVLGATSLDLFAVLLGGAVALLPIYARDILHTGPWGLGFLRAAPAAGAFCMSIWLTRHPIEQRAGKVMFGAVAVYGLATLVFGVSTSFMLSLVMLAVSGAADMISVVIRQSLVQLETPDEMRGRVSAVNSIFIGASNQLGEFESGVTAAAFGPVASVVIGGLGTLGVVGLWMRLFPSLAQRDRLQPGPRAA